MSRPITISLSPNTEPDDVRRAWQTLIKPTQWQRQDIVDMCEKKITDLIHGHSTVLVSSGRRALYETLKAHSIGAGDEVVLQAFTCIAVPAAITWTGATPVYSDIDSRTFNIDPLKIEEKITRRTRAIIAQHTFGIPAPMKELAALAYKHHLVLIEDCAHALGAYYHGNPVGSLGDSAILSFGRDKTLSCVFGGAVVSKSPNIIRTIREGQKRVQEPPQSWIAQQLLHPILMQAIIPLYFTAASGKALLVALQKLGILSKAVEQREKHGEKPQHFNYRFSPALAQLLELQLDKLDRYTHRRRAIARRYLKELENVPAIKLPYIPENASPAWLRFPILIDNAPEVRKQAQASGMLLGDWYDAPLAPKDASAQKFNYDEGSCPNAEEAARKILNLPTHPLMTDKQVLRVIDFMRSVP